MRKTIASLSVVMAVLVTGIATFSTSGMFGNWTATASAPNITAQADTIAIGTLTNGTTTTLGTNITGLAAGDTAYRYVNIQNPAGATNTSWSNLAIQTRVDAASGGGGATPTNWASAANAVVTVDWCANANYTYPSTCAGGWLNTSNLNVGTTALGTATNRTTTLPAQNEKIGVRIGYHLCSETNTPVTGCTGLAATSLQGSTATYVTQFTATQRAGVNTK